MPMQYTVIAVPLRIPDFVLATAVAEAVVYCLAFFVLFVLVAAPSFVPSLLRDDPC